MTRDTLAIALSLARVGWHVFPTRNKMPVIDAWHLNATTDPEQLATWWSEFPDAEPAIVAGRSGLVIVDIDAGTKRGAENLAKAKIVLPKTFHYDTPSGGSHHLYTAPAGEWTVAQNRPVPGVDLRAGNGYVRYVGPELTKKPKLAPAPEWALAPAGEKRSTGAQVDEWMRAVRPGQPGHRMVQQMRRVKEHGTDHETMLDAVAQVVKLATTEHKRGGDEAILTMRATYIADFPEYARHFDAAVAGSIDHWGLPQELSTIAKPDHTPNEVDVVGDIVRDIARMDAEDEEDDDEDFAEDLASRVRTMRIDIQARRMLAAESYTGTEEISWEDLEHHEVRWLVEDLVAEQSLTYLVARANTGKTFTFIDMVARMQAGLPWLGKTTRQAKTLVVLGEGIHGAIDRFRAWSKATGIPLTDIQHGIKFAAGANLNNDESLERLQRMAVDCELIVIDTYAATSGIDKEDDAALASLTLNRAKTINPNAALFFTHHPRKLDEDSERPVMRGSGAMAGAADTVMTLYRDHTYIPDGSDNHKWLALSTDAEHAGKNRNAQTETVRGLYLAEVDGSAVLAQVDGEGISKADKVIRSHLTGPMTVEEFRTKASISRGTALKYLKESKFASVKKGGGPTPDVYSPTSNVLYLISKKKAEPDEAAAGENS